MIRYLIITLIFCSSVFAEIIEIAPGVKIKIPEGKAFYTNNPLDDLKNNAIGRKLTSKETKYALKEFTKMGFSGNEKGYSIVSKENQKNRLRKEDEFEKDEYDIELYGDYDYTEPLILKERPDLLKIDTSTLGNLTSFWENKIGRQFKIHYKDYVPSPLFEALVKIANLSTNSTDYSVEDVKTKIVNNLEKYEEKIIKKFKTNNIMCAYKKIDNNVFKKSETISDLETIIRSNNYQGNTIDVYLFSLIFDIGVLILYKRISQHNPKGYINYGTFNKYFILYRETKNHIKVFDLVQKGDKTIFFKNIL